MFKKFAILCVLLCMGVAMVGCGGNKKAEAPKDKAAPLKEAPTNATVEPIEAPK
jgi:hypothetical protein